MAASYPASLKTFTTKTDKEDTVDASHINDLQDEVVAIETELGTDVAGSSTDLKTRLAVSLADSGALAQGTGDPGSPVIGQPFYRTDTDNFQIYDGTAWDIISSAVSLSASTSPSAVAVSGDMTIEADSRYLMTFSLINNHATSGSEIRFRFNNDTTNNHYWNRSELPLAATPSVTYAGAAAVDHGVIFDDLGDSAANGLIHGWAIINTNDPVASIDASANGKFVCLDNTGTPVKLSGEFNVLYDGGAATSVELVTDNTFTGEVRLYKFVNA